MVKAVVFPAGFLSDKTELIVVVSMIFIPVIFDVLVVLPLTLEAIAASFKVNSN